MIRAIKITFGVTFVLIAVAFLHYTLPQRDIVRVTGTEIIRADFTGWNRMFYAQPDSGGADVGQRDLRLINAVKADGSVIVYRNEDTGLFSWPPYIKVNSSDLHAEASDAVSSKDNPEWMIVRHYGWRSTILSIYPNALSMKPATGPDQRLIPWFNAIVLLIILAIFVAIYVRVKRFWDRRVEPVLDHVDASVDESIETVGGWFRRK